MCLRIFVHFSSLTNAGFCLTYDMWQSCFRNWLPSVRIEDELEQDPMESATEKKNKFIKRINNKQTTEQMAKKATWNPEIAPNWDMYIHFL